MNLDDLLIACDRAIVENAKAFVVVAVDFDAGIVLHATGPFEEAEQALVQAGVDENQWKRDTEDGDPADNSIRWLVVPQWEPSC